MGVDNSDVLQAIAELTRTVEVYHGDFREFRGETKTKVESIENSTKNDRLWMRIQSVCVIPVVGGLHQIAKHFGWI